MSTLQQWWDNVKAWFKRSETIAWARLQTLAGFVLAVAGGIDWTTITSNFANAKQALWIGIGLTANGIVTELLRRRNATLPSA
jgi:hypothetical protein